VCLKQSELEEWVREFKLLYVINNRTPALANVDEGVTDEYPPVSYLDLSDLCLRRRVFAAK
jgi:hypothetical protein